MACSQHSLPPGLDDCISTWVLSSLTSTPRTVTAPSWSPTTTAPAGPGRHSQTPQLWNLYSRAPVPPGLPLNCPMYLILGLYWEFMFLEPLLSTYLCLNLVFTLTLFESRQSVRKHFFRVPESKYFRLCEPRGMWWTVCRYLMWKC